MKKRELEIALRAAARLARETEFFVIGTQAVHAYCPRPPAEVLISQECDLIISKLAAGRLKDLEFVGAVMGFDMASLKLLRHRIGQLGLAKDRARVRSRLGSVLNDLGQP